MFNQILSSTTKITTDYNLKKVDRRRSSNLDFEIEQDYQKASTQLGTVFKPKLFHKRTRFSSTRFMGGGAKPFL